jgi:hypothetical protein
VNGVVKEQTQPLEQSALDWHLPLQAVCWMPLRNCRAETAPALRTVMTMVANKKVWILLFINRFSSLTTNVSISDEMNDGNLIQS